MEIQIAIYTFNDINVDIGSDVDIVTRPTWAGKM